MRTGFPSHLDISDLLKMFDKNLNYFNNIFDSQKVICSEIMRSCGLKWKHFKLGNTKIFFRNGKLDLLSEKLKGDSTFIINRHKKLKILRTKWRIAIIVARLCSIRKVQPNQNDSMDVSDSMNDTVRTSFSTENACSKTISKSLKKRKSYQLAHQSESAQVLGIHSRFEKFMDATFFSKIKYIF